MADEPNKVDFWTAFQAIRDGSKVMRRAGWQMGERAYYKLQASRSGGDPMMVFVDGQKQAGQAFMLITDLLQTDWVLMDAPAAKEPAKAS